MNIGMTAKIRRCWIILNIHHTWNNFNSNFSRKSRILRSKLSYIIFDVFSQFFLESITKVWWKKNIINKIRNGVVVADAVGQLCFGERKFFNSLIRFPSLFHKTMRFLSEAGEEEITKERLITIRAFPYPYINFRLGRLLGIADHCGRRNWWRWKLV